MARKPKPKTTVAKAKKQPAIPLKQMLDAIDRRDKTFYSKLTEIQKKEFAPWLVMRWATSSDQDMISYVYLINEFVNRDFSVLGTKHDELQWLLISMCGLGSTRYRKFVPVGKKGTLSKVQKFLREIYPTRKRDDLELLEELNTKAELKELARDHGYQEKDIKAIFK